MTGCVLAHCFIVLSFQKKTMLTVLFHDGKTLQHQRRFYVIVYKAYLFLSFVIFSFKSLLRVC